MKRRLANDTKMAWNLRTVIALGVGIYHSHSHRDDTLILDWAWVTSGIPSDIGRVSLCSL